MSMDIQFKITWEPRDLPLVPMAVSARGEASVRLAKRLLQMNQDELAQLEGVAGRELLIVSGEAEKLPWVDGVQYLGIDADAPDLLMPTNYRPVLPPAIVQKAIRARVGNEGRLALLPQGPLLASMTHARPISHPALVAWLERQ